MGLGRAGGWGSLGAMRGAYRASRVLVAGLLAVGCVSAVRAEDGGYRYRRHGYRVAAPGGPGPAWTRIDVDDTDLAFERGAPGPRDSMSLVSRCGRPVADAQLMARHLVIGVRERKVVAAGPLLVAGRSGWTQTFDTSREGVSVRVKTVTLVAGGCSFDWVLASAGDFDVAEAAFDAWWESFRLDPGFAEEGSP